MLKALPPHSAFPFVFEAPLLLGPSATGPNEPSVAPLTMAEVNEIEWQFGAAPIGGSMMNSAVELVARWVCAQAAGER